MKQLLLNLSKHENIKIISDEDIDLNKIFFCTDVKICFEFYNKILYVGQDNFGQVLKRLIDRLQKAVDGRLQLHKSLTQNLGFIYNEYFGNEPESMKVTTLDGTSSYWVIYDYSLWPSYKDEKYRVKAWLYNDINGDIIFEATKVYPWFYIQDEDLKRPDFIYYEDFIKDYESLLRFVIPRDIAISWLNLSKKV